MKSIPIPLSNVSGIQDCYFKVNVEYVQLPFLNEERNSKTKTLAEVAIEVLLIIARYTLISSGLVNTDIAFSCNNVFSSVYNSFSIGLSAKFWVVLTLYSQIIRLIVVTIFE